MKELFSSLPHCPGKLNRAQEYPVRLMQHLPQQPSLGQKINEIILTSSDAQAMLQQIAAVLGKAFQGDCLIMIAPDDRNAEHIGFWCSKQGASPSQGVLSKELALISNANAQVLAINDVDSNNVDGQDLSRLELGAVLQIPTQFQGKVNGVINLIRSQPEWSDAEKESAQQAATPVAIALAQIVQTELIASLQQQLQTAAQYQTLINQLTMASRSSFELNQIFHLALSGTAQALKVDRSLMITLKYVDPLFRTREKQNKIPKAKATVVCEWHDNVHAEATAKSDSLLNQSFWMSDSWLCQQAFLNFPKPTVINAKEHKLAPQDITVIFNFAVLPSLVILPLENQGIVLGFLVLQHACDRCWHADELTLLELVSTQISTAMIQSQTLRQVQSLVEERTAQLQRSVEVQAKLYEKTRQQIDQLRHLNQLKDEFLSTMNHELRTPLTSMSLAIRMLRQPGLPFERQSKYLDILEQQCSQEINLINDLLRLQELESNQAPLNLETINLKQKINDIVQTYTEKWTDKGLTLTVDLPTAPLHIQTDTESLERILQELLTNASKYSYPDTTIALKARLRGNEIVFSLTNFGSGISPEDTTHIFERFHRGQGATQQAIPGTGLGLALVKCLVEHLNGKITVSSSRSSDTACEICFTVTLPQLFNQAQP